MENRRLSKEMAQLLEDEGSVDNALIAKLDALLLVLYPDGVEPDRYAEFIRSVCVLERLCLAVSSDHEDDERDEDEPQVTGRSRRGVVVEAMQNDATEPMPRNTEGGKDDPASRPWTYLSAFSLNGAGSEKRQLVSRYAALVERMLGGGEEPARDEPENSNGDRSRAEEPPDDAPDEGDPQTKP